MPFSSLASRSSASRNLSVVGEYSPYARWRRLRVQSAVEVELWALPNQVSSRPMPWLSPLPKAAGDVTLCFCDHCPNLSSRHPRRNLFPRFHLPCILQQLSRAIEH